MKSTRRVKRYIKHGLIVILVLSLIPLILAGCGKSPPDENANTPQTTSDPLVAHWQFDEASGSSVTDATGHGNKGTLHSVTSSTGKIGRAAMFDGTEAHVEVADSDSLDLADSFTITAWINLATIGTDRQVLLQKKVVSESDLFTNYTLYAQWTHDALALVVGDGERRVGYLSDKGLGAANEWHHIAVVLGDGRVRFYIDGESAGETSTTIKPHSNNGPLLIGRHTSTGSPAEFCYHGLLDDLRIYNKVLTSEEIKQMVEGG